VDTPQRSSLKELIREGETQTVEFKRSLSLRDEGLEALCAMVNSDLARGTVVFGVENDGTASGIEGGNLDAAQRSLSQAIRNRFDPALIVNVEVEEVDDKKVLAVSAERSRDVPYHEYDNRAWIRQGSEKRRLSLAEKRQLTKRRSRDSHPGPWRCGNCGSWVGVLHSFEISNEGLKRTYMCRCGGEFWPA